MEPPMNKTSTPQHHHICKNKKKSSDLYAIENEIRDAEKLVSEALDQLIVKVPESVMKKLYERIRLLHQQQVN
jgi:hypothetical protein